MKEGYKVAFRDCVCEFTEKKSRFISSLCCAENADDVKSFIDRVRLQYPDATHNCVAYRLYDPPLERFSDDGEPSGTAGMPMLEVMKKENVYNVCVVVTRYFGGILLGGGGLIRAYSRGVSDALAKAGYAIRLPSATLELCFGYGGFDRVDKYLSGVSCNRISCEFLQKVVMNVSVPAEDKEKITSDITDLLCGAVQISEISQGFDSFK